MVLLSGSVAGALSTRFQWNRFICTLGTILFFVGFGFACLSYNSRMVSARDCRLLPLKGGLASPLPRPGGHGGPRAGGAGGPLPRGRVGGGATGPRP